MSKIGDIRHPHTGASDAIPAVQPAIANGTTDLELDMTVPPLPQIPSAREPYAIRLFRTQAGSELASPPDATDWRPAWKILKIGEALSAAHIVSLGTHKIPIRKDSTLLVVNYYDGNEPHQVSLIKELNTLRGTTQLAEVRIRFKDGRLWQALDFEDSGFELFADEDSPLFDETHFEDHQARNIQRAVVYSASEKWDTLYRQSHEPQKDITSRYGRLDRFLNFLIEQAEARNVEGQVQTNNKISDYPEPYSWVALKRYLNPRNKMTSLSQLMKFAQLFGVDIRELVATVNREYKTLTQKDWMTALYPIYIDSQADIRKLKFFQQQDPLHRSLGWLIFSTRKDPRNPLSLLDLGEIENLSCSTFVDEIEYNDKIPERTTLESLSNALNLPYSLLIKANNYTYYGNTPFAKKLLPKDIQTILAAEFPGKTILDLMQDLFPGQDIYIKPGSGDLMKIIEYARNPDSLGQLLFAARKAHPDLPGMEAMGEIIGYPFKAWKLFEKTDITVNRANMSSFIWLFKQLGIPLEKLVPFIHPPLTQESTAFILAHAIGRKNQAEVMANMPISYSTIHEILRATKHYDIDMDIIRGLKQGLPELDVIRFVRAAHLDLTTLLPELAQEATISLDQQTIKMLVDFDAGQLLLDFRLNNHWNKTEMAAFLDISKASVNFYETLKVTPDNPNLPDTLASILALKLLPQYSFDRDGYAKMKMDPLFLTTLSCARKIVAFYLYPDLLTLLPISTDSAELNWGELQKQIENGISHSSTLQMRHDLFALISQKAKEKALALPINLKEAAETLVSLASSEAQELDLAHAARYLNTRVSLTLEELKKLKFILPEINLREWYFAMNRTTLQYFLGMSRDSFTPPTGWTWKTLFDPEVMLNFMNARLKVLFKSKQQAVRETKISTFLDDKTMKAFLNASAVNDFKIIQMSAALQIDKAILFLFFNKDEIKAISSQDDFEIQDEILLPTDELNPPQDTAPTMTPPVFALISSATGSPPPVVSLMPRGL